MTMRTKLRKLTADQRAALNERIRSSAYTGMDEIVNWLAEKGLEISRSAVHRHVVRLRQVDYDAGRIEARMLAVAAGKSRRRSHLLARLGSLTLEQHRLIAELGQLPEQDPTGPT